MMSSIRFHVSFSPLASIRVSGRDEARKIAGGSSDVSGGGGVLAPGGGPAGTAG